MELYNKQFVGLSVVLGTIALLGLIAKDVLGVPLTLLECLGAGLLVYQVVGSFVSVYLYKKRQEKLRATLTSMDLKPIDNLEEFVSKLQEECKDNVVNISDNSKRPH